jgi:hypothetical protein
LCQNSPSLFAISSNFASTLPSLTFNTTNGQITGSVSTSMTAQTYTVTPSNAQGWGATVAFSIVVYGKISGCAYSYAATALIGSVLVIPSPSGCVNNPTGFLVSPALPAGLTFSASTAAITGTPTAATAFAVYTITPSNQAGYGALFTLSLSVLTPPATGCTYSIPTNASGAFFTITIASCAYIPASFALWPALAAGFSYNTTSTSQITSSTLPLQPLWARQQPLLVIVRP